MAASDNALRPGTILQSTSARYEIADVLGAGGFGITYKAFTSVRVGNITARCEVAIKEFFISSDCERTVMAGSDTTMVTSGPARERVEAAKRDFISEANRLRALTGLSPNIVHVNEVFEANGTAYYVMEYLSGSSLRDYVNSRGPLAEREAIDMMRPLLDAVAALHSRRVMHLDIKPDNIMMARNDDGTLRPVLIDFGQSKHYGADNVATRTVAAAGLTEGYAPIEQYSGITGFSPQTDVYSLAATLLFCLTGRKPLRAVEMNRDYISSSLPATVSMPTREALMAALAMNPKERIGAVDEFASRLYGDPTRPMPKQKHGPIYESTSSRSGSKWLWVILGLLAACLLVGGAVLLSDSHNGDRQGVPVIADDDGYDQSEASETSDISEPSEQPVPAIEEEVRSGTPPPVMHVYNFTGYFEDSKGQRWPVKLKATTDGGGRWGECVYTNVTYGIVLNMEGSGANDSYTFYTNQQGADLTIRISYTGEGSWDGTATSGSKSLAVHLDE